MKRFKNILVVSNDEGLSDAVLARAQWLSQSNGAKLTLLNVSETSQLDFKRLVSRVSGKDADELAGQLDAARRDTLEAVADRLRTEGADVSTVLAQGVGFIETIRYVLRHDHDLVLKAADHTASWRTFGGPDLHLLRKCPCPVWILKSGGEASSKRIMAAVDPNPDDASQDALSHKVMQLATSLAVQDKASLDVLNAWCLYEEHLLRGSMARTPPEKVDDLVEETRRTSRKRLDQLTADYAAVTPEMTVRHIKGTPADVVVQHVEAQNIDTLVMGTVGRTGLPGMIIGNTAETVLSRVACSVLAVKPDDFISPVTL